MPRTLLIDDIREIKADKVARNYWEGIKALTEEIWDLVLLDHDLGCFDLDGYELTGYHVLCWLEMHPEFLPKKIILVTSNPVGRQRMQQVLRKLYS